MPQRIWARDPTVWKPDPATPEIRDRLGWLTSSELIRAQAADLEAFTADLRRDYRHVVLLGMGGSSLAAIMLRDTFGAAAGHPSLMVVDSTDPRAVAEAAQLGAGTRKLYLVSSKSGTTLETDCLFRYFWGLHRDRERDSGFVAITDPGTALAALADARGFRRTFLNPADIGGRYSALSYFGLVPAALLGIDVARIIDRALEMTRACGPEAPPGDNPGLRLGAVLGEAALAGRSKVTLALSRDIGSFGLWLEQLIAESTGKEGNGLVPVAEEPLGPPGVYGADRLFVALSVAGRHDEAAAARLAALEAAGHPVVRIELRDRYDLGAELFRWPFAVSVAGAILGINPFDQPDVAAAKAGTDAVLARGASAARSPAASAADLERLLNGVRPGDYLAVLAYLPPTPANDRRLAAVQLQLRDRLGAAVTVGYGPRYLHSTGQLHKGGASTGRFVLITTPGLDDVPIPGKPYGFATLEWAQAEADLLTLQARGRPALRIESLDLLEATASAG